MERKMDMEKLRLLADSRQLRELREALSNLPAVDVAQFLGELEPETALLVYRTLPKEQASEVFSELDSDLQQIIIGSITDAELGEIMEDLYVDDAVDLLEELPANVVKRVLRSARPETRALINQFLQYPENSAGSLMTAEFTDLRAEMTVMQAIEHIRRTGEDRETIYTCYVIDSVRRLEGVVTVKDLLLAPDGMLVRDLMNRDVISVSTREDQEVAARLMNKYDYLSLPVVDDENRLVGIITVDDAMDVMQEEATEDIEVMGALHPSERPYLKTGVLELTKNRLPWLLILMFASILTGSILMDYEEAIQVLPLLLSFIPMVMDTSGNCGNQSSTMVIRGMAVGDIELKDALRVVWKEFRVGILCGLVLAAANFIRLILQFPGQPLLSLSVVISLLLAVVLAKIIGCLLPMLAEKMKLDPAIMAAPLITTIVDACSLLIFFRVACLLLNI